MLEYIIKKPIAIIASVIIVVLFGFLALTKIPIQLIPDISKPVIVITTVWPGASPVEIEKEIINQQEEVLKGLEGLSKITSKASPSRSEITLEFPITEDINKSLILVSNRLDRVTDYPSDITQPIIQAASSEDSPIAWFALTSMENTDLDVNDYSYIADEIIAPALEQVPGVARSNVYGSNERELQIIIEPSELAKHKISINELINILKNSNQSISAGSLDEGKRSYVIRTEADFSTIDKVENIVIKSIQTEGSIQRIYVKDLAKVKLGFKDSKKNIRHLAKRTIVFNVIRETGANVIETMQGIKKTINFLNNKTLDKHNIKIKQLYDETIYIKSAIDLVQQNILIGGFLAICILFLFLQSIRATIVIAFSIPISIIGSFVAMSTAGLSINVISLAGLAFAVGMVVDAAIVVLENIYKYKQNGKSNIEAAITGTHDVWKAILVSAITTVMVFIPIIITNLEITQLFKDIAIAISVAVILSLLVSITVIPTISSFLFKKEKNLNYSFFIKLNIFGKKFVDFIISKLDILFTKNKISKIIVTGTIFFTISISILILPKLEYLPEGNRNLIFGIILPPPGYNLNTTLEIANDVESAAKPLFEKKINNFFFVSFENQTFVGASAKDPKKVKELIPILSYPIFKNPGTYGFIKQTSLFGRSISSGRTIDFDISGPNLNELLNIAQKAMFKIEKILPRNKGNQFRPIPGLELGAPELKIIPNNVAIADNKLSNFTLAAMIKVANDGLKFDETTIKGKRIDIVLKGNNKKYKNTQDIGDIQIITDNGDIIPVSELADLILTSGPTEIYHKNRTKTVTIQIFPSDNIALESVMELLTNKVINPIKKDNLPDDININLTGTADELTIAWNSMKWQLTVALIISYLIMAILFESFIYPFIILTTVPVAAFGGILGLNILNIFVYQPLDMLTLLGFIILIGIVVNNAILIVHHTLQHQRIDKMELKKSILLATRDRIRPIFMSTLTSLFGMLPLVLFPGSGSELYRGIGSVILGGLSLSTLVTLLLIPLLLYILGSYTSKNKQ